MAKSTALGSILFLLLGIVSSLLTGDVVKGQQLRADHYRKTCPAVEQIVRSRMDFHFQQNAGIAGHLLRLQFHDCGVTGCDASLLLTGNQSEQLASPNLSVMGYEILADIKAQLEVNCTGVVSCADIVTLAARDSVALTGGPKFSVPLGRFDSLAPGSVKLPLPDDSVASVDGFFSNLGLNAVDVVALLGAHTIGVSHCSSFLNRLYTFNGTGAPDPSMNATFLAAMQQACPIGNPNTSTTVALDDSDEFVFDNHWYSMMGAGHGVLGVDQELVSDASTAITMTHMAANQTLFFDRFVVSLIKLGQVGVRDSTTGEIRTNCSVVNTSPPAFAPAFEPAPPPTSGAPSPPTPSPVSGAPQFAPAPSESPTIAPSPTSGA